jgi:mannose-6-phosphate isomerase-like protein (cupin superfamily)
MQPCILPHDPDSGWFTPELCHITELSNSERDEELSIAAARVAPGVTTRWHHLTETAERYVILSGQGLVEIGDLPPQTVRPMDVVLIPPGCRQRISNTGNEDLVFLALCTPRFRPSVYQQDEG